LIFISNLFFAWQTYNFLFEIAVAVFQIGWFVFEMQSTHGVRFISNVYF